MIRKSVLLVCILTVFPALTRAGPIMSIFNSEIILEAPVIEGKDAIGEFRVCNQGNTNLIINNITPDRKCSVASYDRIIPPGRQGKIKLEMPTNGYRGQVTKVALVTSNAPVNSTAIISLTVMVTPIFEATPIEELIIRTKVRHPASVSTIITSNIRDPVGIKQVNHTFGSEASVKLEPINPGKKYQVILTANAKNRGLWLGRIEFDLIDAPLLKTYLPAFVQVKEK